MTTIQGRTLILPETDDRPTTIRVDLRYLLTPVTPFKRTYVDYWRDRLDWTDYGTMLCQQLRRCEGIGSVFISHYGCKAEIGALYATREMLPAVREKVELTLRTQIPWGVWRPDVRNWAYQFAVPEDELQLTADFGKRLQRELKGSLGGLRPKEPWHSRVFMTDDLNDRRQDCPPALWVRNVKIEEGLPCQKPHHAWDGQYTNRDPTPDKTQLLPRVALLQQSSDFLVAPIGTKGRREGAVCKLNPQMKPEIVLVA